jgi:hypothetical protein
MIHRRAAPLLPVVLCLGVAACGSSPLIPDKSIKLTATQSISLDSLVGIAATAAVIQLVYDPLAPNWEIEERKLSGDTYQYHLLMKRYHTGGDGEAMAVLRRHLAALQLEAGYSGYTLLEYSEGIDSQTLGARRYADGLVRLTGKIKPVPVAAVRAQQSLLPSTQPSQTEAESFPIPAGTP